MSLQNFLTWIAKTDELHIMSFSDNELRGYIESEKIAGLEDFMDLFRSMFKTDVSNDFIKLSSQRYYFTIKFKE